MECLGFLMASASETRWFLYLNYIIEYKKFKNKNEEENSVQSRLSRHVAEFW